MGVYRSVANKTDVPSLPKEEYQSGQDKIPQLQKITAWEPLPNSAAPAVKSKEASIARSVAINCVFQGPWFKDVAVLLSSDPVEIIKKGIELSKHIEDHLLR